jgi:hypothetical protein
VSFLAYAEVTRDGGVAACSPPGVTAHRVRKGTYEVGGLSVDRHSTIVVQPKPLAGGDCATLCAAVGVWRSVGRGLSWGPGWESGGLTVCTSAVATLDDLRVDGDGRLRWGLETEPVDADFSLVVL